MTDTSSNTSGLLQGKKGLILGVANRRSIAWGIAACLASHGAELAFTYQGERLKEGVEELVAGLPRKSPLYSCNVSCGEEIASVFSQISRDFGALQTWPEMLLSDPEDSATRQELLTRLAANPDREERIKEDFLFTCAEKYFRTIPEFI